MAAPSCARRAAGPTPPATPWPTSPCSAGSWSSATPSPGSSPSWSRRTCWNAVFLHGHGFWTSLENAIVGPFIAIISFVCSIGNVPLAAALWHGGISFGGVISFIFADLITFPLLLIYRRYYGTRLTLRMLALFWAVMADRRPGRPRASSVRSGIIPTTRPATVAPAHFEWNYTTYLNLVFLALFGLLYWAYRNRERLGGGGGYALDPVCGMQVRTADAPAAIEHAGRTEYFCSDHCRHRFEDDPDRFAPSVAPGAPRAAAVPEVRTTS